MNTELQLTEFTVVKSELDELKELCAQIDGHRNEFEALKKATAEKAIRAGELLHGFKKDKDKGGHGKWLPWLAANVPVSRQVVERWMKLYRRFGSNCSLVNNLTVKEALNLLKANNDDKSSKPRKARKAKPPKKKDEPKEQSVQEQPPSATAAASSSAPSSSNGVSSSVALAPPASAPDAQNKVWNENEVINDFEELAATTKLADDLNELSAYLKQFSEDGRTRLLKAVLKIHVNIDNIKTIFGYPSFGTALKMLGKTTKKEKKSK
jgi:hypothetical protein